MLRMPVVRFMLIVNIFYFHRHHRHHSVNIHQRLLYHRHHPPPPSPHCQVMARTKKSRWTHALTHRHRTAIVATMSSSPQARSTKNVEIQYWLFLLDLYIISCCLLVKIFLWQILILGVICRRHPLLIYTFNLNHV